MSRIVGSLVVLALALKLHVLRLHKLKNRDLDFSTFRGIAIEP